MEKQVDVLIIGAGISGIGVAAHLSKTLHNVSLKFWSVVNRLVELGIFSAILVSVLIQICLLLVLTLNHGAKPMFSLMVPLLKDI